MEVLRALAALSEPPGTESVRLAELLELGEVPAEVEWSDLFLFQLHPYASVYLGADGGLGGEARDRVAGFWRALGLVPPSECDHLAVLLAFQAELGQREMEAESDEERGRWRHVAGAFLSEHLSSWLPAYLSKLALVAPDFYRRWGVLLGEAVAAEAARLPRSDQPPLHWRLAPVLADPREAGDGGGSGAFLDSLLTPAASGLLLVRRDLERAGRDLGLALRVGERRFVLETLLGQASTEVLGWLTAEADGWHDRLSTPRENDLTPGSFWLDRAGSTARLLAELQADAG